MANSTRVLSGGAKDAYLARTIADIEGIGAEAAMRLMERLASEIALVSLKRPVPSRALGLVSPAVTSELPAPRAVVDDGPEVTLVEIVAAATDQPEFDPYSPNVIVVFRTRGRDAVLEQLDGIEDVACLRLLAREQQLGIAADLDDATDIRLAIVAACERRVANRRAAAS